MMETVFKSTDKLSFVIQNDYRLLQVMGRFGITIGFGEKTINEVCRQCNVDVNAFLAVMNYVKNRTHPSIGSISTKEGVASLLKYLKNSHRYFLDYQFPSMRRSLIDSIEMQNEIAFLVLKYYDVYVEEVRLHMANEDDTTFSWVEQILNDDCTLSQSGQLLSKHHDSIERKLGELKKLFLQYYPQKDNNNELNSVIIELYRAEEELQSHCLIEDNLFTPAVRRLESKQKQSLAQQSVNMHEATELPKVDLLSEREKEIVACVAKGLSNKEIAEYLFLSINTVTTHRRNIAKKLSIHSSAGITIYAIVNHLVKIEDVSM
jgi:regulator of cell morphogenesis and NO signaling